MGDGLSRWLTFILAILRAENGLVLVDEIENGIHYSVMAKIWQALASLANQYNVQIIATTHSAECVRFAVKAFNNNIADDFRYYRIEKMKEETRAISYNHTTLEAALESELEFR
jgi:AAA15 family ATPase/GTPase